MVKARTSKKTTKKAVKSRRTKLTTKGVTSIVKRAIARVAENKSRQYYNLGVTLPPPGAVAPFDGGIIPLAPRATFVQIDQGVGNGARIGNSITTKRVMFKGTLINRGYDVTLNPAPQPMQIRLYLFYDKRDPNNAPTPALNDDFYQFNNTTSGFSDNLVDLWSPVNEDCYRVLHTRDFKLGFANYAGLGNSQIQQTFANNDFKLNCNFSIDVTKYLIKTVKFNDNNSIPTTRGLWAMFVPVFASGVIMPSTFRPVQCNFMIDYTFEDV